MPQTRRERRGGVSKAKAPPLYIGQWIRALGMKQRVVARAAKMNEGYLSELCSGNTSKEPSRGVLAAIAQVLQIPAHYLEQPPPDREFIRTASSLDPGVLSRLQRQ